MVKILIDTVDFETRAAILEKGRLRHLDIERTRSLSLAGNIYKAKVVRVLGGLNAAFLNIGEAREAFLPLTDLREEEDFDEEIIETAAGREGERRKPAAGDSLKVKPGDTLLVQLVKDAIGTKGPKVTANNISIPGHMIVFLPYQQRKGVSRRITAAGERDRLLKIAGEVLPGDAGFIIRTAARGCADKVLRQEAQRLLETWRRINGDYRRKRVPACLHTEQPLAIRVLRDSFDADVDEVLIDSPVLARTCRRFLGTYGINGRVVVNYRGEEPLFTAHGVEKEIRSAIGRKVPMEGGGYLIIEETEALCAIDVNSGRSTGEDYRAMVLKTNLKAAQEIAWQLRLRNLGGIIVVDFIDMGRFRDRRQVYDAFEKALEPDKARIKMLRISRFGLVEMTRQRTRESLRDYLADDCPYCTGQGMVLSPETVTAHLRREIQLRRPLRGFLSRNVGGMKKKLEVRVAPPVGRYLNENLKVVFPERAYRAGLELVIDRDLNPDEYKIS